MKKQFQLLPITTQPPYLRVDATVNGLRVRFNGERSETERDIFSNIMDFEGYHIWLGRDDRETSYTLVASYDRENYDKYVWNEGNYPIPNFVLMDIPYSLNQLRCLYGGGIAPCNDSSFKPLRFTRGSPYRMVGFPDSIFYFEPHNFNASELGKLRQYKRSIRTSRPLLNPLTPILLTLSDTLPRDISNIMNTSLRSKTYWPLFLTG